MKYYHNIFFIFIVTLFLMTACSSVKSTDSVLQIKWDSLPSLPDIDHKTNPGVAGAFSGISDNKLIIAGGANFPGQPAWKNGEKKYWDIIYVLSLQNQHRQWKDSFYRLPYPVAYGASVQLQNGILCIGGKNDTGYLSAVFTLQWDEKEQQISVNNFPNLPLPLAGLSATRIGNTVYIAGGENENGKQDVFYKINMENIQAGWEALPSLPSGPLSNAVLLTQSDGSRICLYLMGGRTSEKNGITTFYASTRKFNPENNTWVKRHDITDKDNQPVSLAAGTGIAIKDHYLLLFGGDDGILFNELADYKNKSDHAGDQKQKQYWQKKHDSLFIHHPGFNKQIFLYNTIEDSWTTIGQLPFPVQVTTHCFKYNGHIFITSGEIRPGIRTPDIKIGKIK